MCHITFIHSSVDRHLGFFHFLAVVNSTAMNIEVHASFQVRVCVFSGYMSRSRLAGPNGSCFLCFKEPPSCSPPWQYWFTFWAPRVLYTLTARAWCLVAVCVSCQWGTRARKGPRCLIWDCPDSIPETDHMRGSSNCCLHRWRNKSHALFFPSRFSSKSLNITQFYK